MSSIEDLIQRSRSPGAFVARREFTLSRDKAIEKLREFSLRHPRGYVLEFVQAAVFAGASSIAIDVDDEQLLVAWVGGRTCTAEELENVFDYLFLGRADPRTRHLAELAIGLNAVLKREPTLVRLESGDGTPEGTVRVDLDRRGVGAAGTPSEPIAGSYILAQFPRALFAVFSGETLHTEEALVESRCQYTPVPILLNGRAPFGYRAAARVRMFGTCDEESFLDAPDSGSRRRGVVALPGELEQAASGTAPGLRIVVGGVWISTLDLPALGMSPGGQHLIGVICDDGLRKTADQADIVQDAAFVRMLHAVQPHVTSLMRRRHPGWRPPALPPVPAEPGAAGGGDVGPVAQALPARIAQLDPRSHVSAERLTHAPLVVPVAWVRPEDADALTEAADPQRYPFPVLVLTSGEARTLASAAPELALSHLATQADVDFLENSRMQQGRVFHLTAAPLADAPPLALRLDLDSVPGPHEATGRGVPLSAGLGQRSTTWTILDLDLPGVSAHAAGSGLGDAHRLALADRILAAAWRWVLPGPDLVAGDGPRLRDLRAALLAQSLRTLFVEGEQTVELEALLLGLDGARREAALDLVLADAVDGPLTLRRLLAAQGTDTVLELQHQEERARVVPLEALLGWGHVACGEDDAFPLCAVGAFPGGWQPLERGSLYWHERGPIIYLPLTSRTPRRLAERRACPSTLPLVQVALGPKPDAEVSWEMGLKLLIRDLQRQARGGEWEEAVPGAAPPAQRAAVGRRALAVLELLPPKGPCSLWAPLPEPLPMARRALLEGHPPVLPLGGALVDEAEVQHLSLDALRAVLRVLGDRKPRLLLDDASAAYGLGGELGWLLRQRVRGAGLDGWLALRVPFDPSAAVLIHGSRRLHALVGGDEQAPVHGRVRLPPGCEALERDHEELLRLERRLLYRKLVALLDDPELGDERAAAARSYAAAYALDAWRHGRLAGSTARELAGRVPCSPTLSLLEVLDGAPDGPVPAALHPALARLWRAGPLAAPRRKVAADMAARFQRALDLQVDLEVEVDQQYLGRKSDLVQVERSGMVSPPTLHLNLSAPLVIAAVDGVRAWGEGAHGARAEHLASLARRAQDLLLLEMARCFVQWGLRHGHELSLPTLHRALLASSLER